MTTRVLREQQYGALGTGQGESHQCYSYVMARELTQRELRNQSGEIMRALDRGDSFVVTRRGVPVAELRPVSRRSRVNADVLLDAMTGVPTIDPEALRADLDAHVDQDPTPRA